VAGALARQARHDHWLLAGHLSLSVAVWGHVRAFNSAEFHSRRAEHRGQPCSCAEHDDDHKQCERPGSRAAQPHWKCRFEQLFDLAVERAPCGVHTGSSSLHFNLHRDTGRRPSRSCDALCTGYRYCWVSHCSVIGPELVPTTMFDPVVFLSGCSECYCY